MSEQPQTEAIVFVQEWHQDTSTMKIRREFKNTVGFTYSNDVLNLGDPFGFGIANPDGRYNLHFQRGANVTLSLRNPAVHGNTLTVKHIGIVTDRTLRSDTSGSHLEIQCSDLGWHLRENDAPLWYRLQGGTLEHLLKDPGFIDPSWGLNTIRTDNVKTAAIRSGKHVLLSTADLIALPLNNGRAQAQLDLQALGTDIFIQVEPGDKIVDLVMTYCRRIGRLFTVTPDGAMQIWTPNETATAIYSINYHGFNETNRSLNTVISGNITEHTGSVFTDVTCIGEQVGGDITRDSTNQNGLKRRGHYPLTGRRPNPDVLPFLHRNNFCDGDIFEADSANKQAAWKYNRLLFDSWSATYVVRGHHNSGEWWEVDNFCTVHDSVNGIDGDFYVRSVMYTRDERGDLTTVTLAKPGLLKASFGVFRHPPKVSVPFTPLAPAAPPVST